MYVLLCDCRFSEHHSLGFPVLLVLRGYALWPQVFRAPFSWVSCVAGTTGLCFVTAGFQSTILLGFLCCWYYGIMLCDCRFSEHHSLGFPVLLVLRGYALWPQVFRAPFSWVSCAAGTTGCEFSLWFIWNIGTFLFLKYLHCIWLILYMRYVYWLIITSDLMVVIVL
jgi:hypothetical protein